MPEHEPPKEAEESDALPLAAPVAESSSPSAFPVHASTAPSSLDQAATPFRGMYDHQPLNLGNWQLRKPLDPRIDLFNVPPEAVKPRYDAFHGETPEKARRAPLDKYRELFPGELGEPPKDARKRAEYEMTKAQRQSTSQSIAEEDRGHEAQRSQPHAPGYIGTDEAAIPVPEVVKAVKSLVPKEGPAERAPPPEVDGPYVIKYGDDEKPREPEPPPMYHGPGIGPIRSRLPK
jgi:hypothetical protein